MAVVVVVVVVGVGTGTVDDADCVDDGMEASGWGGGRVVDCDMALSRRTGHKPDICRSIVVRRVNTWAMR